MALTRRTLLGATAAAAAAGLLVPQRTLWALDRTMVPAPYPAGWDPGAHGIWVTDRLKEDLGFETRRAAFLNEIAEATGGRPRYLGQEFHPRPDVWRRVEWELRARGGTVDVHRVDLNGLTDEPDDGAWWVVRSTVIGAGA